MIAIQDFISEDDCRWVPTTVMWADCLTKEDKDLCLAFQDWLRRPYVTLVGENKILQCEFHSVDSFCAFGRMSAHEPFTNQHFPYQMGSSADPLSISQLQRPAGRMEPWRHSLLGVEKGRLLCQNSASPEYAAEEMLYYDDNTYITKTVCPLPSNDQPQFLPYLILVGCPTINGWLEFETCRHVAAAGSKK